MIENNKSGNLERRSFRRLDDNIFISYRLKSRAFRAITQNISGGGLMFEAEKGLLPGTDLNMEIYQPANSFKTLIFVVPVSAKVVWRKKIKRGFLEIGENEYRIGVNFTNIRNEDRQEIVRYTEKTGN